MLVNLVSALLSVAVECLLDSHPKRSCRLPMATVLYCPIWVSLLGLWFKLWTLSLIPFLIQMMTFFSLSCSQLILNQRAANNITQVHPSVAWYFCLLSINFHIWYQNPNFPWEICFFLLFHVIQMVLNAIPAPGVGRCWGLANQRFAFLFLWWLVHRWAQDLA